jgi:glutathione S-transferase
MSKGHRITLRYFDARGRAQFIRYYLTCREIDFDDDRVPLGAGFSEWLALRDNQAVTGPFKRLPVLQFDDEQVSEALVIANFVHDRLGDAGRLTQKDNLRHSMLLSSLYGDLLIPLGMLVWASRMYPGVDLRAHLELVVGRLRNYLAVLDQALADWGWLATARDRGPTLGDCLIWEELDALEAILGGFIALEDFPTLRAFHAEHPAQPTLLAYRDAHPCPFSGNPSERESIQSIHNVLSSIGAEGES